MLKFEDLEKALTGEGEEVRISMSAEKSPNFMDVLYALVEEVVKLRKALNNENNAKPRLGASSSGKRRPDSGRNRD